MGRAVAEELDRFAVEDAKRSLVGRLRRESDARVPVRDPG